MPPEAQGTKPVKGLNCLRAFTPASQTRRNRRIYLDRVPQKTAIFRYTASIVALGLEMVECEVGAWALGVVGSEIARESP